MNDDTKFVPGIFDEMLPLFAPDKVMVGAMCGDDGRMSYGGIKYVKGISTKNTARRRRTSVLTSFNANCAIIPHDIFMKVSIDPFYQHSIGDFDYGLAISRMGYEIRIFPEVHRAVQRRQPEGNLAGRVAAKDAAH